MVDILKQKKEQASGNHLIQAPESRISFTSQVSSCSGFQVFIDNATLLVAISTESVVSSRQGHARYPRPLFTKCSTSERNDPHIWCLFLIVVGSRGLIILQEDVSSLRFRKGSLTGSSDLSPSKSGVYAQMNNPKDRLEDTETGQKIIEISSQDFPQSMKIRTTP